MRSAQKTSPATAGRKTPTGSAPDSATEQVTDGTVGVVHHQAGKDVPQAEQQARHQHRLPYPQPLIQQSQTYTAKGELLEQNRCQAAH